MSKSIKAALWSGLVLPGAGHLFLKKNGRGIGLISVSAVCLYIIVSNVLAQAVAVLTKIETDGVMVNPGQIIELVSQRSAVSAPPSLNIAMMMLALCWIVGVVDAYRLGKS